MDFSIYLYYLFLRDMWVYHNILLSAIFDPDIYIFNYYVYLIYSITFICVSKDLDNIFFKRLYVIDIH